MSPLAEILDTVPLGDGCLVDGRRYDIEATGWQVSLWWVGDGVAGRLFLEGEAWGDAVEVIAPPELASMVHPFRRDDFPALP